MVDLGLLILRLVVGFMFVGHGTQKLFGWFGGGGLEGTAKMMDALHVSPRKFWAFISAAAETFGGLSLALGLLTPLGAAAIIGVMLMAIIKVHGKNGFWNTNRGYEYNLVIIAASAAIGLAGPGVYSLDSALHISYPQPLTFIAAVIIAIVGVISSLAMGGAMANRSGVRPA